VRRPLFQSARAYKSVLAIPVAEHLFANVSTFGRMGFLQPTTNDAVREFIRDYVNVTMTFLRVLERTAGLEFSSDSHFAFCRLPVSQRALERMFGYTGGVGQPLPSEVVRSLKEFWLVQTELERSPQPALAAILSQVHNNGYEAAFEYLFDLNESGYLSFDSLSLLSRLLIQIRGSVNTDERFVELFAGPSSDLPATDDEWLSTEFSVSELAALDSTLGVVSPDLLVRRSWAEIRKLRSCRDIDEWAVQVFTSAPTLLVLGGHLSNLSGPGDLAVRAVNAQLEEMQADLGSSWLDQESGICFLNVVGCAEMAAGAEQQAGPEWLDRAFNERSVIPRDVFDGIVLSDATYSSSDWFHLSWKTIVPWSANFRPSEPLMNRRGSYDGFLSERIYNKQRPESLSEAMAPVSELFSEDRYDEAAELLTPLKDAYPYAAPLYAMLAIVLDNGGHHRAALEEMIPALTLGPNHPEFWKIGARVAYTNGCESDAIIFEAFADEWSRSQKWSRSELREGGPGSRSRAGSSWLGRWFRASGN